MRRIPLLLVAFALPLAACGSGPERAGSAAPATTSETPVATSSASAAAGQCPPAGGTAQRQVSFSTPPPMCIDQAKAYTATVTTDAGAFTIELLDDKAPKTVNNFVYLARHKYYEGVTFHRVIPGFMIQGGDPEGTGSGGPGYTFEDELPEVGEYQVGSVAMANAGPNTNGSQFFVVTGEAGVALPPAYSLFGTVTGGLETVTAIEADGSQAGTPAKLHTIRSVTITEK